MVNLMLYFIQMNCLEWFLIIIRDMHTYNTEIFTIAILKLCSVWGPGNVFLHCL